MSFNYPTCCSFCFRGGSGGLESSGLNRDSIFFFFPPPKKKTKREPRIRSGFPEFLSSHSVLTCNCNVHMKPLLVLNPSVVGTRARRCYLASDHHHRFIPTLVHCNFLIFTSLGGRKNFSHHSYKVYAPTF